MIEKIKEVANLVSDMEAKQKLLEAQQTMLDMHEEIINLKKQLELSNKITHHELPYITVEERPGYYCANCYGKNGILIQLKNMGKRNLYSQANTITEWTCSECKNKGYKIGVVIL